MTSDPLAMFHEWVQGDEMVIATSTADGRPSARALLLKSADERGFTFFTGYTSRKGRELAENPRAALLFRREGLRVPVVVNGNRVSLVPVTLGRDFGNSVEVVSGLSEDAQVISDPPGSLVDREIVRIVQPKRVRTAEQ